MVYASYSNNCMNWRDHVGQDHNHCHSVSFGGEPLTLQFFQFDPFLVSHSGFYRLGLFVFGCITLHRTAGFPENFWIIADMVMSQCGYGGYGLIMECKHPPIHLPTATRTSSELDEP